MIPLSLLQRECGGCTACCTAVAVHSLRKPFFGKCQHETDKGCAVYATRPADCRGFGCAWLAGMGEMSDRPDKLGVVIYAEAESDGTVWIYVLETRPGAMFTEPVAEMVVRLNDSPMADLAVGVRLVTYNQAFNTAFMPDQKRWPGTEPRGKTQEWYTYDNALWRLRAPTREPCEQEATEKAAPLAVPPV